MNIQYIMVKKSDVYPAAHFRAGIFFTALSVVAMYYLPLSWNNPFPIIATGTGFFLFGYILAHFRRFKRLFSFGHEMKEEVHQMALETMEQYGLLGQKQSVFIFASLLEKRIECFPSSDLTEAMDYQEILKQKKKEFKGMNPKQMVLSVCEEIEKKLNDQNGLYHQEGPKAVETTTPPSHSISAPEPVETNEESPRDQVPDQNNTESQEEQKPPQP